MCLLGFAIPGLAGTPVAPVSRPVAVVTPPAPVVSAPPPAAADPSSDYGLRGDAGVPGNDPDTAAAPSNPVQEIWRMFQALVMVLVLIVCVLFAIKRWRGMPGGAGVVGERGSGTVIGPRWLRDFTSQFSASARGEDTITVRRSQPLPGGGVLHIVSIAGRKFLIGATAHNVSLLSEWDGEAQPAGDSESAEEPAAFAVQPRSTADPNDRNSAFQARATQAAEYLGQSLTARKRIIWISVALLLALAFRAHAAGQAQVPFSIPTIPGSVPAHDPKQVANTLQVFAMMTILTAAPALLIMTTAFTRIVIVLSFLRSALGTQNIPPNQIVFGLALFLTFFVMNPTFQHINHEAVQPYFANKLGLTAAIQRGEIPLRRFMVHQTYRDDLKLFLRISKTHVPVPSAGELPEDALPMQVVIPAFVISELKTGFIFGFIITIPFIVIDLVVASLLMSMGMMMLPPTVISLPAKILVFILADGWHAIAGSLVASYRP